ncbi:MAG: methyltransferase/methylase [Cyclobacteriaceae bacterium]|nr:MAG: methyltransferase/methylase [Cyclobacteriaceae bacterium]
MDNQLNPSKILQVGMGFFASKTLLTAVNMELFTSLAVKEMTADEIKSKLGLHPRSVYDFLDALVALKLLERRGLKETAVYSNTPETDLFLDKAKPSYVGGILEMANKRLYPFWGDLEQALKNGQPQNEAKSGGDLFEVLYSDQDRLKGFLNAMAGVQMGNFIKLAKTYDFSEHQSLCDLGGAGGFLAAQVAIHNQHMKCISFDLPQVEPIAKQNIASLGVSDRVSVQSGDFFKDEFPKVDIITMGNILHDWGLEEKKLLISKVYEALPKGGVFMVVENIIDDQRRENAFGLLMSLNMLIETTGGFDFSLADFDEWAREAGFSEISSLPLTGPASAAIAIK